MKKLIKRREILVYANWIEIEEPIVMGTLYSEIIRGKEIFYFQYANDWLNTKFAQIIDPNLQLFGGLQYLAGRKENFGVFLDSAPDRWGRLLMRRIEAVRARNEKRAENNLSESDYLLGVFDEHRMGGLRFKDETNGPFLNNDKTHAVPPWSTIKELEKASQEIERDEISYDPEYLKWLNMLIAPGSSLGGARPKASVVDECGNLWIAKFPSINDDKDIGAWEMVVRDLASKVGLNVPEAKLKKFSGKHHTFLSKRFDRNKNKRIHFASAMTMLGFSDGNDFQDGASYLELAAFLSANGANVKEDLKELWKRIVFSICVSNTDDHLRNHGFILTSKGWILSPAYDINPVETGTGLKLNISQNDNSLDFDLAMEVVEYFRLDAKGALKMLKNISNSITQWKLVAECYGISKTEINMMAKAFRVY